MKRAVDVVTATGAARNFMYAYWVCDGYNPLDHVFWRLMESTPPGDRSWEIVGADICERYGHVMEVPIDILDRKC